MAVLKEIQSFDIKNEDELVKCLDLSFQNLSNDKSE